MNSMLKGMNAMVSGFEHMNTASSGAFDMKSMSMARSEMAKAGAAMKQYESSVSKAEKEQTSFNSTAKTTTSSMGGLITKVGALAAGYMSLQAVGNFIGMSDTYSQTTARLGLMNDGLQTTAELQDKIFESANDAYADTDAMSDMVGKLGLMAGDAFSNSGEIVDFAEQISKQFVISGASATQSEAAMLQLTQAMASGVLRGDELNSIFENSSTVIQTIADYLGVPIGQIREMASEGEITADIIKSAMFKAANATDAKFEAMGMTFDQAWTVFQNKSGRAFKGVFTQMNQLANSDALDGFLDGLAGGVEMAASIVSTIGSGMAEIYDLPVVQSTITTMAGMLPSIEGIGDTIGSVVESVKKGLEEHAPEIEIAVDSLEGSVDRFNKVLGGEPPDTTWIGEMVAEVVREVTYLTTFLNDSYTIISGWGKLLGSGFKLITGVGDSETLEQFKIDYTALDDSYTAFHDDVLSYMGATGKESATAYTGSFKETLTGDTQIADAVISPMATVPQQMNVLGQQAGSEYGAALLINQGAVQSASSGLGTATMTPLQSLPGNLTLIGADGVTGMSNAIYDGQKGTGKSATSVKDNINKIFSPLPKDTRSIADYAMDGLEAGIRDWGGVEGAVIDASVMLLKSFKNQLGIKSPSTEMYDIGTYTMAGLINSLMDSDIAKFCESIVADMKAAFETGNFNIQAGIEYIGSGAAEFFKSIGIGGASLGELIQPVAGAVTSGFGYRDPFMTDSGQMSSDYHEGIDIGAGFGTPIGAAGAGTVIFAGRNGGYGNMVEIDHGGGMTTLYAHMDSIMASLGQVVSAGQTIGTVGSTGNSTGAHLHFGIYQDGVAIDPGALWGYSSGTMSARAGLHLVGENGPEVIGFNGGETVLNSKKTKLFQSQGNYGGASVSGGQDVTVQVNMNGVTISNDMDIEVVADRLGSLIVEKMRTRASVAS